MQLKLGQTITCIKDFYLRQKQCLTKKKQYKIVKSNEVGITIIDDENEEHDFQYDATSKNVISEYFTTEPPKKERYFIVFFNGNPDIGYLECITTDGGYISQTQALGAITEYVGYEDHTITNIIELNQQDYESWNK